MNKSLYSFIFIIILIVSSCSNQKTTTQIIAFVAESEWQLVKLGNEFVNSEDYSSRGVPKLNFLEYGKIAGFTGCNQFQANYKLNGETISINPGAMTKMLCPKIDDRTIIDALQNTHSLEMEGEMLVFKSANGASLMKYVRVINQ